MRGPRNGTWKPCATPLFATGRSWRAAVWISCGSLFPEFLERPAMGPVVAVRRVNEFRRMEKADAMAMWTAMESPIRWTRTWMETVFPMIRIRTWTEMGYPTKKMITGTGLSPAKRVAAGALAVMQMAAVKGEAPRVARMAKARTAIKVATGPTVLLARTDRRKVVRGRRAARLETVARVMGLVVRLDLVRVASGRWLPTSGEAVRVNPVNPAANPGSPASREDSPANKEASRGSNRGRAASRVASLGRRARPAGREVLPADLKCREGVAGAGAILCNWSEPCYE